MQDFVIRPGVAGDADRLRPVVEETGLFPAAMLPGLIGASIGGPEAGGGACWLTCLAGGGAPAGLCHARAEDLAEGTWTMLALAVLPAFQRRGAGAALVAALEDRLRAAGARLLLVDTSGTAAFAPARAFYARTGYAEEARIRDYWADGDDRITFRKRLR